MKTCNKCGVTKDFNGFYREAAMPDGYRKTCKECKNKMNYKWREENREKYNGGMRRYNSKNYQKIRMQRYGITPDDHNQMMIKQNGSCDICGKKPTTKRPLAIDHDHETGKVRGLLCYGCNRVMHVIDNQELLEKAI